jgi:hypothetical protein
VTRFTSAAPYTKTKEKTEFEQKDAKEAKTDQDGLGTVLVLLKNFLVFAGDGRRDWPFARRGRVGLSA